MKTNVFRVFEQHSTPEERCILDWNELKEVVDFLKSQGKKIVITSGTWDLFHVGHAKYLRKAKECGDVLIVGVDSDELTRSFKEPNRPMNPQDERLFIIGDLRSVDLVTLLNVGSDKDGEVLVRFLQPDVLVISESTRPGFVESIFKKHKEDCGEIIVLPPQSTTSTTAKIRKMLVDGGKQLANFLTGKIEEYFKNEENEK